MLNVSTSLTYEKACVNNTTTTTAHRKTVSGGVREHTVAGKHVARHWKRTRVTMSVNQSCGKMLQQPPLENERVLPFRLLRVAGKKKKSVIRTESAFQLGLFDRGFGKS